MPRCLIVDDDRDGREGYAEYLRAFGFEVDEAVDAEAALKQMRRQRPDIVLLDLQMPGMDGWELIRQIRVMAGLRTVSIIAISACVFPEDQARAEEAGCDAFLAKPCIPSVVLDEVMKRLKLSKPPAEQPIGTSDAS
jgi:CheY-like chemotaxis protein